MRRCTPPHAAAAAAAGSRQQPAPAPTLRAPARAPPPRHHPHSRRRRAAAPPRSLQSKIGIQHKLTKEDAMKWFQTKFEGIILNKAHAGQA